MSDLTLLRKEFLKTLSETKLQMYRNLSYGAAGVLLIIIIMLAQIWKDSLALNIGLYGASIGLPAWITAGTFYEFYVLLGEKSYAHFKSNQVQGLFALLFLIGGISIMVTVSAIIFYLSPIACLVMLCLSLVLYLITRGFMETLKQEMTKR